MMFEDRLAGRMAISLFIALGTACVEVDAPDDPNHPLTGEAEQDVFGYGTNAPYTNGYFNYPQLLWANTAGDARIQQINSRLDQPRIGWWLTTPIHDYADHWRAVSAAGNKIMWWRSDTRELALHSYGADARYVSHRTVTVPAGQGTPIAIASVDPRQCRAPDRDGYLVLWNRSTGTSLGFIDLWVTDQAGQRLATRLVPRPTSFRTYPVAFGLGVVANANTTTPTTRAWAVWAHYTTQNLCEFPGPVCRTVTQVTGYEIDDLDLDAATGRYAIRTRSPVFSLATALSASTVDKASYAVTGFGVTARTVTSPYNVPIIKNYLVATTGRGAAELIEISPSGVPVPSGNRQLTAPEAGRGTLAAFSGEAFEGCALDPL
jgi:hypothetical protein